MKIKSLLIGGIVLSFSLNAQQIVKETSKKSIQGFVQSVDETSEQTGLRNEIWTDDFSDANNWVIGNIPGNANNWVISTNGPTGAFSLEMGAITSATSNNGFALFDSDRLGELNGSAAQNGFIRTANPIDLSANNGVIVEFQQYFRQFNGRCFVEVSTNGTDWTGFEFNQEIAVNASTSNPSIRTVNISSVAGGQAEVWIRFRYQSSMQGGEGDYAWMVDDVKVIEAPDLDLVLNRVYTAEPGLDIEYTSIPLAQATVMNIGAAVFNAGGQSNTFTVAYDIRRGGTSVNSGQFPAVTLSPGQSDTAFFNTNYTPDQIGNYTVQLTVNSSSGEDANPANNTLSKGFRIDEHIFSSMGEVAGQTQFQGATPPFAEYEVGNLFVINNTATLYGVQIAFGSNTAISASGVNNEVVINVYEAGAEFTPVTPPYFYALQNGDVSSGTSLNYRNIAIPPVDLEADKTYLLTIGSVSNARLTFQASLNAEEQEVFLYGPFGTGGAVNWFFTLVRPAINMNFDQTLSASDIVANDINLNVYPNPANELLRVSMNIEKPEMLHINLFDINGRLVYTENQKDQSGVLIRNIDLSNLSSGLYNLQVISGDRVTTRKVSIAK